jgi:hypothetical protein
MKLPHLSSGSQQDGRSPVVAGEAIHPQSDIWACARCGGKVATLCPTVCSVDPTGAGCMACLGSSYDDCKACFGW